MVRFSVAPISLLPLTRVQERLHGRLHGRLQRRLQGRAVGSALVVTACAAALCLWCSTAEAQSGLKLGEQADEPVLDLGARRGDSAPAQSAPSSGSSLDPGAPSIGDGGGELERTTYGAWDVACASNGQCAMAQVGEDGGGTPVLEMVIRKLPEPLDVGDRTATAVLDVVTPLGVVLIEGLSLTIDGGRTETAPFQICTEQGCLVREPIDDDLIARLKRGSKAVVGMVAANQGPIQSELSLSGFTKGYDSIR